MTPSCLQVCSSVPALYDVWYSSVERLFRTYEASVCPLFFFVVESVILTFALVRCLLSMWSRSVVLPLLLELSISRHAGVVSSTPWFTLLGSPSSRVLLPIRVPFSSWLTQDEFLWCLLPFLGFLPHGAFDFGTPSLYCLGCLYSIWVVCSSTSPLCSYLLAESDLADIAVAGFCTATYLFSLIAECHESNPLVIPCDFYSRC